MSAGTGTAEAVARLTTMRAAGYVMAAYSGEDQMLPTMIRDVGTVLAALSAAEARALAAEARVEVLEGALQELADEAEAEICQHDDTYRGGSIWTICRDCERKWADDEGGFKPYTAPAYITRARAALTESKAHV